ncbi:Aste57867_23949 [Aphanomyces stellatus]|uniref:Aste57867_23949 protein n=1 Tax=Aphanomyces stellatus TaxID=120398 RepID=A0A485LTH2_9STRA|nr:hypothetical protein As57867_023876 [Aphanomyces stellatus]VFU00592.1 Aste57867_23949 [Aphanomyces stellatus]
MEFAALSRQEQKARLKEWNEKAKQLKRPSGNGSSGNSLVPMLSKTPPESATSYASTPAAYLGNEIVVIQPIKRAAPLTSVAAVQASYKERWRDEEAQRVEQVKRGAKYKAWNQRLRDARTKPATIEDEKDPTLQVEKEEDEEDGQDQDNPSQAPTNETLLRNMPYAALRESKAALLAHIRASLLQGTPVRIWLDTAATRDSISDARLLAQQLCLASMLFCDRAQDIVPCIQGAVVSMTLVPKTTAGGR